ncbi:MAG: hypothetical protein WCN87_01265 [Chlamydiota bacterium]
MTTVNKSDFFYTVGMLIVIAFLVFLFNLAILGSAWEVTTFRGPLQVKAISVVQKSKSHYITSLQKKELLALLNEGVALESLSFIPSSSSFKKIDLHLFEEDSIEIMPKGLLDKKMVFSIKRGMTETFIVEKEAGQIEQAITRAFED